METNISGASGCTGFLFRVHWKHLSVGWFRQSLLLREVYLNSLLHFVILVRIQLLKFGDGDLISTWYISLPLMLHKCEVCILEGQGGE